MGKGNQNLNPVVNFFDYTVGSVEIVSGDVLPDVREVCIGLGMKNKPRS
jgi:hypothetical protein